ncbi:MAG: hypothetical protein EA428_07415 [Spirochaetaceae bacterium]|nr:MAG: hypothetical protein EA428_07415 [Spirochaetaceae bacterium]
MKSKNGVTRKPLVWIVYAALCLIFGTTFLAIKIGSNAGIPPFIGAGVRFVVAGVVLVVLRGKLRGPQRPSLSFVGKASLLGLGMVGLAFACTYWSIQHLQSGYAAQIQSSAPIIVALLAAVGALVALGAELFFGLGTIWHRFAFDKGVDSLQVNGFSMLSGGLFLCVIAVATAQTGLPLSFAALSSLLYLVVVGSIGGHSMYLWLVGQTGPVFASTWLYISPVIATFVGSVVLSEAVGASTIAGAALVLMGVYWINRAEHGGRLFAEKRNY